MMLRCQEVIWCPNKICFGGNELTWVVTNYFISDLFRFFIKV